MLKKNISLFLCVVQIFLISAYAQGETRGLAQETRGLAQEEEMDTFSPLHRDVEKLKLLRESDIYNLLPEEKKKILASISDKISKSTLEKLLVILSQKDILGSIDFLDELYLITNPIDLERYIMRRYLEIREEVPLLEKFYSAGPELGIKTEVLRQIGYDLTYARPDKKISTQFISQGYTLGPGDSLFLYVWGRVKLPDVLSFPMMVTILHDGRVFIPLVGPVSVGGMTLESASEIVRSAVRRVLGDVEVAVSLSSLKSIPVVVVGEVRNPGVIILSGTLSPFEAIQEAGGIKNSGSLRNIEIRRDGKFFARIDLYDLIFGGVSEGALSGVTLKAWDVVFVPRVGSTFAISGSVKSPGIYEMIGEKISLKDAVTLSGGFIPAQGKFRIRIKRLSVDRRGNILDIIVGDENRENILSSQELVDGDFVEVYPLFAEQEDKYIFVSGYVRKPQKIPYVENMTLKDAIMLSGGFTSINSPYAYEIIRYENGKETKIYKKIPEETRKKDLNAIIDLLKDEIILPYDRITIFPPPENEVPQFIQVSVSGEVLFPGKYMVQKGDRLYDLLKKAGGFTDRAYTDGIIFTRQALKYEQMRRIDLVTQLLTKDIIGESSQYVQIGGTPIRQPGDLSDRVRLMRYIMELSEFTGRIVLKIDRDLEKLKDSKYNIELQPDDAVLIPQIPSHVIVAGEVKNPATFSYVPDKGVKFYVELSGGYTKYANKSEVFIIRANGQADTNLSKVNPGDTIVVPPRVVIPYETWYIIRDVLSVSFQGLTAGALMLNALK